MVMRSIAVMFAVIMAAGCATPPARQDPEARGLPLAKQTAVDLKKLESSDCPDGTNKWTTVANVLGGDGRGVMGKWERDGDGLLAMDHRGEAEFTVTAPSRAIYRLELDVVYAGPSYAKTNEFRFVLRVDDQILGRRPVKLFEYAPKTVHALTPWLSPGDHTVRAYWDQSLSPSVKIRAVRLQSLAGPDVNKNGVADWVEAVGYGRNAIFPSQNLITSPVSPAFLEGKAKFPGLVEIELGRTNQTSVTVAVAPNDGWYVNVPLTAGADTTARVHFENRILRDSRVIRWEPTNVLETKEVTIRKGDALLIMAQPAQAKRGQVSLIIKTGEEVLKRYTGTLPKGNLVYRFDNAGTYEVDGEFQERQRLSGQLTVHAVEYQFTTNPVGWVEGKRDWDLPCLPAGVILESDANVVLEKQKALSPEVDRYVVTMKQVEPLPVVARLGKGGPILAAASARGFLFWSSTQFSLQVVEERAGGPTVIEMRMVLSPALPEVELRLKTIANGLTFPDGSKKMTISGRDFDEFGEYRMRFHDNRKPIGGCHHGVDLYQGETRLGGY